MTPQIFNQLMSSLKFHNNAGIDNFNLTATLAGYSIDFGYIDSVFNLEDFGCKTSSGWQQFEPTEEQITAMEKELQSWVKDWKNLVPNNDDGEWKYRDLYDENGVRRENFY